MPPISIKPNDGAAYQKLCAALRRGKNGLTVADICAATALPLSQVKELIPRAADEFSARLKVTESGEIIYSFPDGFKSRYRGFGVTLARFAKKFFAALGTIGMFVFKVWIMIMLIGYFVLFLAIALGSILISIYANSKNSSSRRGSVGFFGPGLFDMIFRLWFYSELTNSMTRRSTGRKRGGTASSSRPLHRAIFSFVFGDGDSRQDAADTQYKKAVIACIQARRGLITLPEFMAISGKSPVDAEQALMAFCVEYGGMPEATDDGTIVYRFEELLLRAHDQDRSFAGLSPPISGLKTFSRNPKTMNIWFGVINTVNLIFGSYFAINAARIGAVEFSAESTLNSLYDFAYMLFGAFSSNPLPLIAIGLGAIPLVFSALFWLIPAVRSHLLKKDNERVKFENLRRVGFTRIWTRPDEVREQDIRADIAECKPKNTRAAQERVLREMGAYSPPDIVIDDNGVTCYSFNELAREKAAVEKCRAGVSGERSRLGGVVFDSGE